MRVGGMEALQALAREGPRARYPDRADPRMRDGALFPDVKPKFALEPGSRVFTIGSCFAREIEWHLERAGYDVPAQRLPVPVEECPGGLNAILNEFNPGTMGQRIERAFAGEPAPEESVVRHPDGG